MPNPFNNTIFYYLARIIRPLGKPCQSWWERQICAQILTSPMDPLVETFLVRYLFPLMARISAYHLGENSGNIIYSIIYSS